MTEWCNMYHTLFVKTTLGAHLDEILVGESAGTGQNEPVIFFIYYTKGISSRTTHIGPPQIFTAA